MATTKTKRVTKKKSSVEMMPMFKNMNEQLAYKQKLYKNKKNWGLSQFVGKMPEAQELLDALMEERKNRK